MTSQAALPSPDEQTRASRLALLAAALGLSLGAAALGLGLTEGAIAFWGFGAATLLRVPLALNLWWRLRAGLGNRGLDLERRFLRALGLLLRVLALGITLTAGASIFGHRSPEATLSALGLAALAVLLQAVLWLAKLRVKEAHPAMALDAVRARTQAESALLLLAGVLLGRWFFWADAVAALALALRLFLDGRAQAQLTNLSSACGGCGSGCGCG